LPKADLASAVARAKASAISPSDLINRMPRPPPPAMAFSAMPDFACFLKNAVAPARSMTSVPGSTATLHFAA
jgi:hypothetical protein